ncbi:hypothetical protein MTO96_003354 [Rhipicephalus appendiculatus]
MWDRHSGGSTVLALLLVAAFCCHVVNAAFIFDVGAETPKPDDAVSPRQDVSAAHKFQSAVRPIIVEREEEAVELAQVLPAAYVD